VAVRTGQDRVTVRDPGTGAELWHYQRSGTGQGRMAATENGRALLVGFVVRDRDLVVALDSATGAVRWERWQPSGSTTFLLSSGVLTVFPDDRHPYGEQARLDDPGTGRPLWSADLGQWCHAPSAVGGAGAVTVTLTPCPDDTSRPGAGLLGARATGPQGAVTWQVTVAKDQGAAEPAIAFSDDRAVGVHAGDGFDVLDPASGTSLLRTPDRPVAESGGDLVLAAGDRVVVRDLADGTTRTAQVDGPVLAAGAADGHAYVVTDTPDGGELGLEELDLATGRVTGTWQLPQRFTTLYRFSPIDVTVERGAVLVSGLSYDIESDTVAVRVP
jgi:outer membrane protein assembly factor BamB